MSYLFLVTKMFAECDKYIRRINSSKTVHHHCEQNTPSAYVSVFGPQSLNKSPVYFSICKINLPKKSFLPQEIALQGVVLVVVEILVDKIYTYCVQISEWKYMNVCRFKTSLYFFFPSGNKILLYEKANCLHFALFKFP